MDQHHPANKRVSICIIQREKQEILHHGFKKWESSGYHDGSASQWKETKWDGNSIPCKKNPCKNTSKKHITPVIISMEYSLPFGFPPIFPFLPMDSGSFSGPGGGTQARNWPMFSSRRHALSFFGCEGLHSPKTVSMADCQLQWKGLGSFGGHV